MLMKTVRKEKEEFKETSLSGERTGQPVDVVSGYGFILFGYPFWLKVNTVNTYDKDNAPQVREVKTVPKISSQFLEDIEGRPLYERLFMALMFFTELFMLLFLFIPTVYTLYTRRMETNKSLNIGRSIQAKIAGILYALSRIKIPRYRLNIKYYLSVLLFRVQDRI